MINCELKKVINKIFNMKKLHLTQGVEKTKLRAKKQF